jgi:hypothetical protein
MSLLLDNSELCCQICMFMSYTLRKTKCNQCVCSLRACGGFCNGNSAGSLAEKDVKRARDGAFTCARICGERW